MWHKGTVSQQIITLSGCSGMWVLPLTVLHRKFPPVQDKCCSIYVMINSLLFLDVPE